MGKDHTRHNTWQQHMPVTWLTMKADGCGRRLYKGIYSLPDLFDNLTWGCQNKQEGHTTGSWILKNKNGMGQHSNKDQRWPDSNSVERQEIFTCWWIFIMHQPKVISAIKRETLWNHSLWRIITITWIMWIREMGWLTTTPSALQHMEMDKEIVLPCVRSIPNRCTAMWWKENFTWEILNLPF